MHPAINRGWDMQGWKAMGFAFHRAIQHIDAMNAPKEQILAPSELIVLAQGVMQAAKFPFLASQDQDQPRVRPVSPVRTEGFIVYVANLRCYHKTIELLQNPQVELCYMSPEHDQVRITGRVDVVEEPALIQSIWDANPLLRKYLGSPDNPEWLLYRVVPSRVRYMKEWALHYHEVPLDDGV